MSRIDDFPTPKPGRPVWLHVGTLIDGTSSTPWRGSHVVYDADAIRFVGHDGNRPPASVLAPGQSQPDLVLPAETLLPGLTEAHAHLFLEGGELDTDKRAELLKRTPGELLRDADARMPRLLDWGVTAVRDAGDRDGVGLALSRKYRVRGSAQVPYYESPGAAIHHRGRYGSFMADPLENDASPRACVEARIEAGADRIKLIPTGIINFKKGAVTSEPQMSIDEVTALADAAREFGLQSFAHASGDAGIERVIEGRVDSIEHGYFIREDQLARARDRGIAWVPTFAPVAAQVLHADRMGWDQTVLGHLRRILESHAATLRRAHELGVLIVAGSDAGSYGVPHGRGLLWEMELMEEAGLPAIAVINAATGTGSTRLAFREKFGRIDVGYLPRFVLASQPPLQTVKNLSRERVVIFDGRARILGADTGYAGL